MSAQLVSTSTSDQALASTIGAKVIVAADGTALVIYYTGSAMAFRYASSPYSSWSSATTLPSSGSSRYGAAVHYNSSDDSVDVVYHVSGGLATYVKLSKSGSTYSAGSATTVVAAGGSGSSGEAVWIGKDGSGTLWVVCLQTNTTWEAYYSTNGGSTWTASITGATMGGNSVDQPCAAIAGNYLVVCYSKNNGNLAWRRIDTTGTLTSGFWSAEQTTALGPNPDFYAGDFMSMATDGSGRAILVMSSQPFNFGSGVWGKVYTPGSDSWGADTHLGTHTGGTFPDNFGAVCSNGTDVWAVYGEGQASNNYKLVTKKWSNGGASWAGSSTQLEAAGNNISIAQPFATSSTLFFAYTQGTASPWSVYFDSLSTASHVSHTSSGALAQVKKTNLHTSTGALAQVKRFGVQHTSSGARVQIALGTTHTSTGALAQLQAHVAHTASAVLANVKKRNTHSASKAVAQIAKIPPLAPVISRSPTATAYASEGTAGNANDSDYGTIWQAASTPSGVSPVIWAVDLSSVPAAQRSKVVLAWYNETADGYWQPTPIAYSNTPEDYTIETNTAAGGSYPPGGVWTPIAGGTITGNVYWAREHAFDLAGANWVRMVVTKSHGSAGNTGVALQLDIHDASRGDADDWLLLGDSITAEANFRRNPDGSAWTNGPLARQVNTSNPTFFPLILNGGYGGQNMQWGATNIAALLAPFSGRYVSVALGTNDVNVGFQQSQSQVAAIYANLLTILDAIVAAGKIPVVPYVPYGTNNSFYLGINAQQFNAYVDAHLPIDRAGQYLRGPDLYTPFYQNPGLLRVDGIHPTFAANSDGTQTGYDLIHRVWRDWMLANIYGTPHQSHVSSGARAQITRADGKLHVYHTSSGATAVIAFPTHHQSTGARAQLKKNTRHTSSAALAQTKAHATHSSTGALAQVKQHSAHTSSAALAQLSKRVGHPSIGALANVKKTTPHTSSGARAQVSAAGHATHTSTGALAQVKQRALHTSSAALAQVRKHNTRSASGAVALVQQHVSHTSNGARAQVRQHVAHTSSDVLAQVKQHARHTSSAALANVKQHVRHTSSGALAQIHHTDVLHFSTGALAQISTAGHATHTASGALAQVKQHVRHTASAVLAQVKQHNTHSSAGAVVLLKRTGIKHSASGVLVQVTRTPIHQSTGALAQLRAHVGRNSVGARAQVKRRNVQHKASGALAQIALPPAPVATGVTLIQPPIAAGSPVEL